MLNKKDPIDKQIFNLAKKGELKVSVVWVKEDTEYPSKVDSYKHLNENIWKNYQKEKMNKLFN